MNKAKLDTLEIMMPHGRIPKEILKEIWNVYNEDDDKELAYKLAVAALEYALCGTTNFDDDKTVMRELRHYTENLDYNLDSYNMTCEATVYEKQYEEIARMYWQEHKRQTEIGRIIGVTQQEISRRIQTIQKKYPDLYRKYHKKNT